MSFFFVWAMLHPLVSIAVRMGKAARLEEDDEEVGDSTMAEIGNLQRAFVEMRDELSRIRAFVPQSLLKAGITDSDASEDSESILETDASEEPSNRSDQPSNGTGAIAGLQSTGTVHSVVSVVTERSGGHSMATGPHDTPKETPKDTPKGTFVMSKKVSALSAKYRKQKHGAATRSNLGVRKEQVSVLAINLRGYHHRCADRVEPASVAKLVDAVLSSVESEKGVLDSFHGDRFFVSFNAVRTAANHGVRAAVAAMRVTAAVEKLTDLSLPVSCGVATGVSHIGNLGSKTVMRFSIIGPVVSQAVTLERMCKMFKGVSCLLPQRLIEDARTSVELHPIDYVQLPFMKAPCLIAAVVKEIKRDDDQDMEWMYQLEDDDDSKHADATSPTEMYLNLSLSAYSDTVRGIAPAADLTEAEVATLRKVAGAGWSALAAHDFTAAMQSLKEVMTLASKADSTSVPPEISRFVAAAQASFDRAEASMSSVGDNAHAKDFEAERDTR